MSLTLFKANKKNSGALFNFSVGKDQKGNPALFMSATTQTGWNDDKGFGSFKGGNNVNVKLSVFEAGEFISSINNNIPFSAFHKFDDVNTIVNFGPFPRKRKLSKKKKEGGFEDYYVEIPSFSLNVNKSGNSWTIGLEPGETEVLKALLLKFVAENLQHNADVDKENYEKRKKDNGSSKSNAASAPPPPEPEAPADNDEDDSVPF